MNVPTQGETFAQFIEHTRKAQEQAAMLAHLARANDDTALANGWLAISERLKLMAKLSTELATKGYH